MSSATCNSSTPTFTDSEIPGQVGKTPAYSPSVLVKGGLQLRKDNCFDLTFSAVYVSDEFWADANVGTPTIPAKIPSYVVLNLNGDFRAHEERETDRRHQ